MSGWYFFYFLFVLVACTSLEEERKIMFYFKFCLCRKVVFFPPSSQFNRNVEETVPLAWYTLNAAFIFEFYMLSILKGWSFLLPVKGSGLKE